MRRIETARQTAHSREMPGPCSGRGGRTASASCAATAAMAAWQFGRVQARPHDGMRHPAAGLMASGH